MRDEHQSEKARQLELEEQRKETMRLNRGKPWVACDTLDGDGDADDEL